MAVIQQTVEIDETRRVLRLEKSLFASMGGGMLGKNVATAAPKDVNYLKGLVKASKIPRPFLTALTA